MRSDSSLAAATSWVPEQATLTGKRTACMLKAVRTCSMTDILGVDEIVGVCCRLAERDDNLQQSAQAGKGTERQTIEPKRVERN